MTDPFGWKSADKQSECDKNCHTIFCFFHLVSTNKILLYYIPKARVFHGFGFQAKFAMGILDLG